MLREKQHIEDYDMKAIFLRKNGWTDLWHVEWFTHPTIHIDSAGISIDSAYKKLKKNTMKSIKPNSSDQNTIGVKAFLAGSIEMGVAIEWQLEVEKYFEKFSDITLYNPRRDDWDPTWGQTPEDKNFVRQVNWELENLEEADFIFFFFDPKTLSPISLIEFGLYVRSNPEKIVVCCPDGFWKKGNLQVTGKKYGVKIYDDLPKALSNLHKKFTKYMLAKF